MLQALERHPRVEGPPMMGMGSQPLVPIRIARWWHFTSQDFPLAIAKVDAGGDEEYDKVRDQVSSWKVCTFKLNPHKLIQWPFIIPASPTVADPPSRARCR